MKIIVTGGAGYIFRKYYLFYNFILVKRRYCNIWI